MAEKLGIGSEIRQLKIGQSFTNPRSLAFHSIKYDFKPASVDTSKIATVDVGNNHQVTVTVPHLDGAGVPQTVFKGSQRPYQKECVLVIDKITGEITLEKLACNIQLKKTRSESSKLPIPQQQSQGSNNSNNTNSNGDNRVGSNLSSRSQTPPIGQRISNKTKVTSGSRRIDRNIIHLVPKHSPLHASPSYPSPNHHNNINKSPKNNESHNVLGSLPIIGMDDFSSSSSQQQQQISTLSTPHLLQTSSISSCLNDDNNIVNHNEEIGEISDTTTSADSDDSDSDSDIDKINIDKTICKTNGFNNSTITNGGLNNNNNNSSNNNNNNNENNDNNNNSNNNNNNHNSNNSKLPTHLLNEDLCLSESGSDSD